MKKLEIGFYRMMENEPKETCCGRCSGDCDTFDHPYPIKDGPMYPEQHYEPWDNDNDGEYENA